MAKAPTAKQIAARKKFVAGVRSGKFRKKKRVKQTGTSVLKADKKRKAKAPGKRVVKKGRKKTVYYEYRKNRSDKPGKLTGVKKRRTVAGSVAGLKTRIRQKLDADLKELLFKRDKATTYKQHRSAQTRIDKVRKELRKLS